MLIICILYYLIITIDLKNLISGASYAAFYFDPDMYSKLNYFDNFLKRLLFYQRILIFVDVESQANNNKY